MIILAAGEKIKKAVDQVEVGDFANKEEAVFAKLTQES
ncbi:MAG: CopG family transcriptional regulator [Microcystis sp. M53603_WE2]|nr:MULTISPECIES: CopG family transcriptional regulator [unclassified Microcystis]MDJ0526154.1 CopG family transcriptional regulator [Microcystis sp. M53600_WE12]MDJ0539517.1 CopG family transcriptional regulator [Microcystis sp. M53603_WE2]MDJ0565075.1 CopG family transcriptional regulator [Microcystis sp. M49629_WE12]MDJ0606804.1 CopG family transcriptional regulator [Microcystis sp. M53602_WE12]